MYGGGGRETDTEDDRDVDKDEKDDGLEWGSPLTAENVIGASPDGEEWGWPPKFENVVGAEWG